MLTVTHEFSTSLDPDPIQRLESGLNFQLWQQWFTGCRKKSEFWWQLPQNVHRPLSSVLVFSLTRKKKARVRGNATLSIELATLFWNRLNAKSWGLLSTQPFFGIDAKLIIAIRLGITNFITKKQNVLNSYPLCFWYKHRSWGSWDHADHACQKFRRWILKKKSGRIPDFSGRNGTPGGLGQYDRRYRSCSVRDGSIRSLNSADTGGNYNPSRFIRFLKADETPVKSVAVESGGWALHPNPLQQLQRVSPTK